MKGEEVVAKWKGWTMCFLTTAFANAPAQPKGVDLYVLTSQTQNRLCRT